MVVRATGNRPLDKVGGFIHVLFIDIKLKFMQKYNIKHENIRLNVKRCSNEFIEDLSHLRFNANFFRGMCNFILH